MLFVFYSFLFWCYISYYLCWSMRRFRIFQIDCLAQISVGLHFLFLHCHLVKVCLHLLHLIGHPTVWTTTVRSVGNLCRRVCKYCDSLYFTAELLSCNLFDFMLWHLLLVLHFSWHFVVILVCTFLCLQQLYVFTYLTE